MTARRRRHTAMDQDTSESEDYYYARSRKSQRHALPAQRSLSLRRVRYRGPPLPSRGKPQVILMNNDNDSCTDNGSGRYELGGVSLLSPDEGLPKGDDDEDEEEDMAPLPKSRGEPNAEEHTDLVDVNTGFWHSELVRLQTPGRCLVRVEGASRLLLFSPTSLRADSSIGGSLAGTMTICSSHW